MDKGFRGSSLEGPPSSKKQELSPLRPDEIEKGLKTKRLGRKIHYFAEIDSTNLEACKLAERRAGEGEVVIADTQTRGKGRMGRTWVSPPGLNLYLSVILRPELAPVHAPQMTLMAAVALAETVQAFIPRPVQIKWPNDILVEGKKLAGILSESSCEPDRIRFVVIGIGVNVNFPQALMPQEIKDTATSILSLTHTLVDRTILAQRLIQNLDQCYGDLEDRGFPSMAGRWERFFYLRGKRVRVEMLHSALSGRVVGIDVDGALLLEDESGVAQRIVAGDVIPVDL